MYFVIYYMLGFLAIGGVGMAIANKKATANIRKQRWLKYFTYIFITGSIMLSIFTGYFVWIAALIGFVSLAELYKINTIPANRQRKAFWSTLVLGILLTGFILFGIRFNSPFITFIYFQVLIFDGFCQITGQLWGRHLLVPAISPSKTIEGLVGGTVFCVAASVISKSWIDLPMAALIAFGLLTAAASFSGDLLASVYKRMAGVKDYSNWLPGQGGFLDRFDSFIMTGFVYYLSSIILPETKQSFYLNMICL